MGIYYFARPNQMAGHKFTDDLDCAIDFIAELILVCDMPKEAQQKMLRPIRIGIGDYMGSGYAFTDSYNKIFNEFLYNCSEELWQKIRMALDNKQIKERFYMEVQRR